MDKKELQNLIDRISLTGPEGIKKIKKVLKELNDGSGGSPSGSMGEDEEYTIAQALNDLNERIAALENAPTPTPASQTHVLEVNSLSESSDSDTIDSMLQRLELDGHTPTIDELEDLDINITYVSYRDGVKAYKMRIVGLLNYDTEYHLLAGAYMDGPQKAFELDIDWDNQRNRAYVLFFDEL